MKLRSKIIIGATAALSAVAGYFGLTLKDVSNYDKSILEDKREISLLENQIDQRKRNMAQSLYLRGYINETLLRSDEALNLYKEALELCPDNQEYQQKYDSLFKQK